jgi:ParB-like chromosome segregation protein Spo0J
MQQIVPFTPMPTPVREPTAQQRENRTTLINAAKMLNEIGWGNQGDIEGIEEAVPVRELWPNPLNPLKYTDEEIDGMTKSLQTIGQTQAITVAYIESPGVDTDGMPRGHLMIVDGKLRYLGASAADWDYLRACVKRYQTMAEVMLEFTANKISQHPLTGLERGRLMRNAREAFEQERANWVARGLEHPMQKFYTQEELAMRWGCSQTSIHNWIELAKQPEPIITLVETGKLSESQAIELFRIKKETERIKRAQQIAARGISSKAIRLIAERTNKQRRKSKPIVWQVPGELPVTDLWANHLADGTPPMVALGCYIHDIRAVLEIVRQDQDKLHPILQRLTDLVNDDACVQFTQEIGTSALGQ